jgi:hypothetical protein
MELSRGPIVERRRWGGVNRGAGAMRHLTILATGIFLFAAAGSVVAGPFPQAGFSRANGGSAIILVQDKPKKDETLKQKVKRAWRNIAGYKFDVNCPVNSHRTCAETGKDRNDARTKCISRNPLCWVSDAR